MTIAFVQTNNASGSAVTTVDVSLTVTAGNLAILLCTRTGATDRNLSSADNTNAVSATVAVAETVHSAGNAEVAIDYIPSLVGGATTFRLTASGSTVIGLQVIECSGHDSASALDASSTAEQTTATTHICAAAGAIDTVANAFVVFCIAFGGTLGTYTGPSGFTVATPGASINARGGYKGPGTYTDENASQSTTTARSSVGAVASFKSAPAGGSTVGEGLTNSILLSPRRIAA